MVTFINLQFGEYFELFWYFCGRSCLPAHKGMIMSISQMCYIFLIVVVLICVYRKLQIHLDCISSLYWSSGRKSPTWTTQALCFGRCHCTWKNILRLMRALNGLRVVIYSPFIVIIWSLTWNKKNSHVCLIGRIVGKSLQNSLTDLTWPITDQLQWYKTNTTYHITFDI